MKKLLVYLLMSGMVLGCFAGCGSKDEVVGETFEETEDEGVLEEESGSYLTIYANGGTLFFDAEDPYEAELSASYMEKGSTFAESVGVEAPIKSIEKEGAEFAGWTVYAVNKGEWVQEEVTDLAEGQLCAPCGDYGFLMMEDYEVLSEAATTEELEQFVGDGRECYAVANWK